MAQSAIALTGDKGMATRMASPLAGFRWLARALNIGGRNPKTLLLAAAVVGVIAFVPSLVTVPLQMSFPGNQAMFAVAMMISLVAGLLLSPVFAGFLQVIDAIENGRPVRARDVFAPYRTGLWKPVVGFTLCLWGLYLVAFALIVLSMGADLRGFYAEALTATQAQHVPFAELPPGFLRAMVVAAVSGLVLGGVWALGNGQVAIGRQRVLAAFADGIVGTLKNALGLIALAIGSMLLAVAFFVLFLIVAKIIGLLGKFVGMWLAYTLLVPFYLGVLVGMYVLIFGVAYHFWRDVCGGDAEA